MNRADVLDDLRARPAVGASVIDLGAERDVAALATATLLPLDRELEQPVAASKGRLASFAAFAADVAELAKVRVALLVLFTTLAGFVLATGFLGAAVDGMRLCITLAGTGLVAASAAAINQVIERRRDALMERTRDRPLPAGRRSPQLAVTGALVAFALGMSVLWLGTNRSAAAIAALSWASYAFIYTPLKTRTHLSTVVGAVPGALPPLIGWTAAGAILEGPAWSLFGILFFWQLPHFLAIAWLYREDYARGGYPLLTVTDPSGGAPARQALLNTLALLLASLIPAWTGDAGPGYLPAALVLGSLFLASVAWLAATGSRRAARGTILASVAYLPLLLLALVLNGPSP